VLGCASIARRRVLPALVAEPDAQLVAVASRSRAKCAAFAAEFGCAAAGDYDELLARTDLDAVYIPVPTGLHEHWAARALRSGRHVLCEKPVATSAAGAAALFDLAAARGLVLMENLMFLRHGQHEAVERLVAAGAIGEVRGFSAAFGIPPLPDDDVRYDPALGGGALFDVGVYPLRAAQLFLGAELEVAGAVLSVNAPKTVDTAGHVLAYQHGGVGAHLAFGFVHGYHSRYELWGSEGRLVLDRAFTPPADLAPVVRVERPGRIETHELAPDDQVGNTVRAFAQAALGRTPPPGDNGSVALARLVERVRAAAATTALLPAVLH
jgi:NDP-hexose-3-ketoreductase